MTHTAQVSELTNYNTVLSHVDAGEQVVITKNGVSRYAIIDIDEWRYTQAMMRFMSDMRAVDDEMRAGGATFTEDELLASLGIASAGAGTSASASASTPSGAKSAAAVL